MEKEVVCNKVQWSKNVKGQPQQRSDDGDKKIHLNKPSRQSSKPTL